MRAAQRYQPRGVLAQPHISGVPVEPGDLVVLAVGVVVTALGPAYLVAAEYQRHAEREQQRGQHRAGLPGAQRVDLAVVCRPFGTAVPGPVVVGALAVVLAVRLVVLGV